MGEYNLIDEDWIPTDKGLKSLKDIFSDISIQSLTGNPIEKISILKLLLAIAQSAYTPKDDYDWQDLGVDGLSEKCLEYLDKWYDKFYLFSDEPFLQMKSILKIRDDKIDKIDVEKASGNTSVLFNSQISNDYSYSDIALLLISQIGYGFGSKKIDNSLILTNKVGYNETKGETGKAGLFVGSYGYLHTFITANSILDTIYLNLFCEDTINELRFFEKGLGIPAWEKMPETEICEVANNIEKSFIGRLVPLSRFCLLVKNNDGISIKVTDGIYHKTHKDGGIDTSITTYKYKQDIKAIWSKVDRKPWRNLTAYLSFLDSQDNTHNCLQIENSLKRVRKKYSNFYIWSSGIQVSSNSGEQYVSGNDNYVDSIIEFSNIDLGKIWYKQFKLEMEKLENLEYQLKKSIEKYYEVQKEKKDKSEKHDKVQKKGKDLSNYLYQFWELCEKHLNELLIACNSSNTKEIRKKFSKIAYEIYDLACPKNTSKQIKEWAKNKPSFYEYVNGGE